MTILPQIDDVVIIILSILLIINKLQNHGLKVGLNFSSWFFYAFASLFIASGMLNHVPITNLLLALKTYFIYLIFFTCLVNLPLDSRRIIKLIIICFVLQIPIMALQLIRSIFKTGNFSDDTMFGTFPGANNLGYSIFFPLFFVTYMFWIQKKIEFKYSFWLMLLILFAVRADYAIGAYFGFFVFLFSKQIIHNRRRLLLSISMIIIIALIGLAGSSGISRQKSLSNILNPSWWIYNLTVEQNEISSGAQRNLYFPLTYQHLQKFAVSPLIGMGPGMYSSYVVDKLPTDLSKLIIDVFGQTKYGLDAGVDSEIIPIWGEFGYLGIILFVIFLCYSCFHFKYIYARISDPLNKGVVLTASIGSIFLLFGFYTNKLWETQPVLMTLVLFWALAVKVEREYTTSNANINF